ncbi:hypothetical protein [Rubrivirga sp. SAORIC476]|uniref:hypothetical protein n=1 Tax=Rubrivirga sp. SAORIC476 TaxID=1961794 RepID=UPI001179A7B3|nr:hypothetical protein [Rubrivirga sp. SAORIC476]
MTQDAKTTDDWSSAYSAFVRPQWDAYANRLMRGGYAELVAVREGLHSDAAIQNELTQEASRNASSFRAGLDLVSRLGNKYGFDTTGNQLLDLINESNIEVVAPGWSFSFWASEQINGQNISPFGITFHITKGGPHANHVNPTLATTRIAHSTTVRERAEKLASKSTESEYAVDLFERTQSGFMFQIHLLEAVLAEFRLLGTVEPWESPRWRTETQRAQSLPPSLTRADVIRADRRKLHAPFKSWIIQTARFYIDVKGMSKSQAAAAVSERHLDVHGPIIDEWSPGYDKDPFHTILGYLDGIA